MAGVPTKYLGIIFRVVARNCRNELREMTLGELCCRDCAILLLPLLPYCFRRMILGITWREELFLDGLREARVILERRIFEGSPLRTKLFLKKIRSN